MKCMRIEMEQSVVSHLVINANPQVSDDVYYHALYKIRRPIDKKTGSQMRRQMGDLLNETT